MRSLTLLVRYLNRLAQSSTARVLGTALLAAGFGSSLGPARAQEGAGRPTRPAAAPSAAPPAARAKDSAEIRELLTSFAKAVEARDAKALAGHWTAEGEYHNAQGVRANGRDALEAGFTTFFAKTPEVSADLQAASLRFLSADSALQEGTVTVHRGPAAPTTRAHYSALLVREQGKWRLAMFSESERDESPMEDLAWLIGQWKSAAGEGVEVQTTYSWDANKKFIHAQFAVKGKERAASGHQVIGVDPETGELHSWTFEANGGIGEADWNRDGDHWLLTATGTLADGSSLAESNILRRVNEDTFTWQSIDRQLDDAPLDDLAPVKITRIKTEK
ncbi:MAG: SgcJ/EcaC family oxidoreductase [Pirellulales bacterium]|nr:SgcJ/EcaC family oxidoreductase [Pirellulales bacterium]